MKRVVCIVCLGALTGLFAYETNGVEFTLKPGEDAGRVRDEIRAARKAGKIGPDEPVTVTLSPGDHVFRQTLTLEAADSGAEGAPVTWRAEKSGTVRLMGGAPIPRDAFRPVAGDARQRLDPAVADKVLVADVRAQLVGTPKPWADAPKDSRFPGPWLYVGGKSQQLARWPNADAPEKGWYGFSNVLENCGYEADKRAKKPAVLEFPGNRAERWRFDKGVWFMGYFVVDWDCDLHRVASYDKATHGARFAGITRYGVGKGGWPFGKRRFFAVNLLEELDAPREWYFDREEGKVYWYPGADEGEIVLAQDLTPVFRLDQAHHVRIENLGFTSFHGDAPVIVLKNTRKCFVRRCSFENVAGLAVDLSGERNRVTGCRMRNLGSSVLHMKGGDRRNLLPANNLVDGCEISNFGMYQRAHSKAFQMDGCGNAIRECKVTQAPEGAVSYSGNEHLIADNEFGHIVLEVGDAGAIYSGHHADWLGTVIFGNYIHHLAKTEAEESSRCAIYFDDCDWGDDAIGNTLVHCGMGFLLGGGKLHGLHNNLIVDCSRGFSIDGRGRAWRMDGHSSFYWAKNGKTYAEYRHDESKIDPDRAPWCVAYPTLREAMDNRPEYPLMNEISGNVLRNCKRMYTNWGFRKNVLDLDRALAGNTMVTNSTETSLVAPQPIRLKDAVGSVLQSPDGQTVARIGLDASAHFSWSLSVAGRPVLAPSPLGITVGSFDYGHRVVPGAAEDRGEVALTAFTNATRQVAVRGGLAVRNQTTNLVAFASMKAREWRIPLKNLITAQTVAYLDVRVWNGGAAYRWTVPGEGVRKVAGENDAFLPADGNRASIIPVEWERDRDFANGYPEALYYERGKGWGVAFPEFQHGWSHTGPVVSPWRGVLFAGSAK